MHLDICIVSVCQMYPEVLSYIYYGICCLASKMEEYIYSSQ